MARLGHQSVVVVSLLVAGLTLSSCGSGGAINDARAACVQVHQSLVLYAQSQQNGTAPARRNQLENRALTTLLRATPSAAAATSIDGSWNPLMTTINEAERVPMNNLVASLTRLCQVADSSTPYL